MLTFNQVNSVVQKRYKLNAAASRIETKFLIEETMPGKRKEFSSEEEVEHYLDLLEAEGKFPIILT